LATRLAVCKIRVSTDMKTRTLHGVMVAVVASCSTLALLDAGCSSSNSSGSPASTPIQAEAGDNGGDDATTQQSVRTSGKGEACKTTSDCTPPFVCSPTATGGVCAPGGQLDATPTGKACFNAQCRVPTDCCLAQYVAYNCPYYKNECQTNPTNALDGGPSSWCVYYDTNCKCDSSRLSCDQGACVAPCNNDPDAGVLVACTSALDKCIAGKCVQCSGDSDCAQDIGQFCNANGKCQSACSSDGDCPGFSRCSNSKCVDSGCQSNEECIDALRRVDATCNSGHCSVPCQSNIECGNPYNYDFYACVQNVCTFVGCSSDKDCEVFFYGPDAAAITTHPTCR
jgi:hypothetical protein